MRMRSALAGSKGGADICNDIMFSIARSEV